MEGGPKKASRAIFVLALISFFLPFVTFSCQGQKVATFSGIQLMTGTTIQQPQMFGSPKEQKMGAEPLAVLAFLCGIAGLAVSFFKTRVSAIAPAIAGGAGLILILALKSKLDGDVLRQGQGVIQTDYAAGYYLVLSLFIAAAALNFFLLMQRKGIRVPVIGGRGDERFCTRCGSTNVAGNLSCKECGTKLVEGAATDGAFLQQGKAERR